MAHALYELDVRLREIQPAIWRTIEVPGASTLEEVHFAIQVAMGWTNSHLHQFLIGEARYGMADVDEDLELEDEREVRLQDLVKAGTRFVYEYDFGDGWEHDVTVKKVTTQAKPARPRCTGGARACPPEDCGGPGGYDDLLAALRDPRHEEHERMMEWSDNFQPERFAIPRTGLDLRKKMIELAALAREGGEDDGDARGDGDDDVLALPKPLVEAVLALEPMQRASLGALIAGSLASELVEVGDVARRLLEEVKKQRKAVRKARS